MSSSEYAQLRALGYDDQTAIRIVSAEATGLNRQAAVIQVVGVGLTDENGNVVRPTTVGPGPSSSPAPPSPAPDPSPTTPTTPTGPFAYGGDVGVNSVSAIEGMAAQSGITLTVTQTIGSGGYHLTGNAIDFSNGGDAGTPEMDAFAAWWLQYAGYMLELIHVNMDGGMVGVSKGQVVDALSFFGAETMAQHHNHVHVAITNSGVQAAMANGPLAGSASAVLTSAGGVNLGEIFSVSFWERIGIGIGGILLALLGADIMKRGLHVRT